MKEYEQYYTSFKDLKGDYPRFAYALNNYISSLPEIWFFKECFNPDFDGSRFAIEIHDGRRNAKHIMALKNGDSYDFEELQ